MFRGIFGRGLQSHLVAMNGDPESKKGGVTAWVYKAVLEKELCPLMQENLIFMHDNASIHTKKNVKKWLREKNYEVMVWPPYLPDFNHIENLLFLLKEEIYICHLELITMGETNEALEALIAATQASWQHISQDVFNILYD
jgi:transposase